MRVKKQWGLCFVGFGNVGQGLARYDAVETRRTIEAGELPFEFMLNALRLVEGVPAASFAERTGLPLATVARPLARAAERGLLDADPATIRPTALGLRFLNDLQQLFLP